MADKDKGPKHSIVCKIADAQGQPCGKIISEGPPLKMPGPGEEPRERERQIIMAVVKHISAKHPAIGAHLMATWQQFLGWNALGFTRTTDPAYPEYMGRFASHLCKLACGKLSDEQITQTVENLFGDQPPNLRKRIADQMRIQRDFISSSDQLKLPLQAPNPAS